MQTRGSSSSNLSAQEVTKLRKTVANLQNLLVEQQNKITVLEGQAQPSVLRQTNPLRVSKFPPIPIFTEKDSDYASSKIKAFVSNVIRVARLSNYRDEDKVVQLATCHFHDRASTSITRLEEEGDIPKTVDELKAAILKEFVPCNEKARAQLKLLTFKMHSIIDKHIKDFKDLIETCDTPVLEVYSFFFMTPPQNLKEKMAEEFLESDPENMREVYKCDRKHEITEKWATGNQSNEQKQSCS